MTKNLSASLMDDASQARAMEYAASFLRMTKWSRAKNENAVKLRAKPVDMQINFCIIFSVVLKGGFFLQLSPAHLSMRREEAK